MPLLRSFPVSPFRDPLFARIADGSRNVLDTKYYRYYTGEAGGYVGGLKYAFNPDSYARLIAAVGDPTQASDAQVAPYADNYFEYDSSQRVTKEVVQGAGCSLCGNGQNERRAKPVPMPVIQHLIEKLEPPTWAEAHSVRLVG
jgi:hypothetical protein